MTLLSLGLILCGFAGGHRDLIFGRDNLVPSGGPAGIAAGDPPHAPAATLSKIGTRQTQLATWFFSECARPSSKGALAEEQWYSYYCEVCARSQDIPLPLDAFRSIAKSKGATVTQIDGRYYYQRMLPLVPAAA